jgi:hypothetical protein
VVYIIITFYKEEKKNQLIRDYDPLKLSV